MEKVLSYVLLLMVCMAYAYGAGQQSVNIALKEPSTLDESAALPEPPTIPQTAAVITTDNAVQDHADPEPAIHNNELPTTSAATTPEPTPIVTLPTATPDPIVIDTADLDPSDQRLLDMIGLGEGELVITDDVIECIENKFGRDRMEAIIGGATPSFGEAMSFLGCYQGN